jgi:MFS family permease
MTTESAGVAAEGDASRRPSRGKLVLASTVGTSIEWYDYYIFGTASALVFGGLFFPGFSPVAGTLAAFTTFAVGFVARPLGGAIIGHFGDRIGRKSMLVLTLLLTGTATVLIGLLPTYAAIGVAAPLLLVLLRLVQGFGVGGEWGGAMLIAAEHAGRRQRAMFGSFAQFGVPIGVLTSNLAFLAIAGLSDEQFKSWGWRIPFLLSIILLVVGIIVRRTLTDSPEFQQAKLEKAVTRVPVAELFRRVPGTVVLASLASIANPALGYTVIVYMLSYGTALKYDRTTLLTLILISTVLWIAMIYVSALLSDRFGAKRIFVIGAAMAVVWAFPLFWLVDSRSVPAALIAFLIAGVVQAVMAGAQGGLFSEIFDVDVRYSGVSISYQLGGMVGGALTPIVATALFAAYKSSTPIAIYLLVMSLLSFVAVIAIRAPHPVER